MNKRNVSKLSWSVAALLVMLASVWASEPAIAQESDQPMIGQQAPSFTLMDLSDTRVSSDDLRGSYVVIHFAASW